MIKGLQFAGTLALVFGLLCVLWIIDPKGTWAEDGDSA